MIPKHSVPSTHQKPNRKTTVYFPLDSGRKAPSPTNPESRSILLSTPTIRYRFFVEIFSQKQSWQKQLYRRQIPRSRKTANPEISRKYPEIPEIELHLCLIDGLRTIINRSDRLISGRSGSFRKFRHRQIPPKRPQTLKAKNSLVTWPNEVKLGANYSQLIGL